MFAAETDWVFASPATLGKKPYWPDMLLRRHVLPAAERAGIRKKIGWHTFRRTVATLMIAQGANVKVVQELLGHASPSTTMNIYVQAVDDDKRAAAVMLSTLFGPLAGEAAV